MKANLPTTRLGFLPPNARRNGGGGRVSQVVPSAPAAAAPAALPAPPTPAAAPTATNAEVIQARNDLRRQALKRRGYAKTIFAGDNSGWHGTGVVPSPNNPTVAPSGGGGAQTLGGR